MELLVQIPLDDAVTRDGLLKDGTIRCETIETKGFDGFSEVISLLVYLTPVSIPVLGKVIIEHIRSRKEIRVIHRGTEISGLSPDNVIKVLEALYGNDSRNNP